MSLSRQYDAFLHAMPSWRAKVLEQQRALIAETFLEIGVQDALGRLWVVRGVRGVDDGQEPFPDPDRHLWLVLQRENETHEVAYGQLAQEGWVVTNVRSHS